MLRARLAPWNMFKPPPPNFITDRFKALVLLWLSVVLSWCQTFGDVSQYVRSDLGRFVLLSGHLLGQQLLTRLTICFLLIWLFVILDISRFGF